MAKIVFEDKCDSPISKLLIECFGSNVEFSGGSHKLMRYVKDNLSVSGIIYIDVVPDNLETVVTYNKICSIKQNRFVIIPIPCVEYFVIKAFMSNVINIDELYLSEYRKRSSVFGKAASIKSFEKYCKSIVYNYSNCYKDGRFFTNECRCGTCYTERYATDIKRSKLIHEIPVFYQCVEGTVSTVSVDVFSIKHEYLTLYNNARLSFIRAGYIEEYDSEICSY